jgi:hypothetical protein
MHKLFLAAALLLGPTGAAYAQCAGTVGVTNIHNCAPGVSVQLSDEIFAWQTNQNPHTRRITAGQIIGTLNSGTQVGSPSTSDNLVMAPNGTTPQLVTIGTLLGMAATPTLNAGGTMNGTFAGNPTFSGNPVFSGAPVLSTGVVTATGGATTKTLADWTSYVPIPNSSGASQVVGPDGAINAVVGWVPQTASPIEAPTLLPGTTGSGATYACQSSTSVAVGCNIVAQGAGNVFIGNGSGPFLGLLDPADVVSVYYTMTPGTISAARPNTFYLRPVTREGVTAANFNIITAGGFGAGVSAIAQGAGCTSLGSNTQCQGLNTLVSGNLAYDFTGQGVRVHSSYSTAGQNGGNQIMEQTLQHTFASTAGASRLVMDGGSGVTHSTTIPMEPLSHGTWTVEAECSATVSGGTVTAGDTASWKVDGTFTKISGTLTYPLGSGAATNRIGSGTLSTASLTITADTTNNNMSLLVTPPTGNTGTIGCTAYVRWLQRLS